MRISRDRARTRWPLIFLVGIALSFALGCQSKTEQKTQTTPLKLTLAFQGAPYSGLIAVADEKDFFRKNGVEVTLKEYPSGLECLNAMRSGEAQVATVADIAFAGQMNGDPSLRVLASIGLSVGSQIVARKDKNILQPSDLKGKKVGFSPGTASDYFLHAFLLANHLSPMDIDEAAIPPARQVEAVVTGEVDAVSAFEVNAFKAKEQLGGNAVYWETQNSIAYHWLLAATENTTKSPEPIKRFLKALVDAENYVLTHQDETKSILSNKWGFSPDYIRQAWTQTRFDVSLNQTIVTSLETYTKWYMEKDGKAEKTPDVLNSIYTGILDEIDPKLVTIFR